MEDEVVYAPSIAGTRLLPAKLCAPSRFETSIPRLAIEQLIATATPVKIILFQSPAGFGKTTAMLQYHQRQRSADIVTGWINLDDEDNDFERFCVCVEQAIVRMAGESQADQEPCQNGHAPGTRLIERMSRLEQPFALFMDDFEVIKSTAVLDLVHRMVRYLPMKGQLVIGTRSVPSLGLGRLRATSQLLEIGPEHLRFSPEETDALLREKRGLPLSDDDIQLLHNNTEGWVAGLHLAALELSSTRDQRAFVTTFSGSNASVAHYLTEDVLAGASDELQQFLLRTSVLNELSAPLCNALLGHGRSAELIAQLVDANLFLVPLDGGHVWYRYQTVFANFLLDQLNKRHPELIADLHCAASRWYADEERPISAIEHALLGKDTDRVLSLLNQHITDLLYEHRFDLIVRWFRQIPAAALDSCAELYIYFAWAFASIRKPIAALQLLDEALRASGGKILDATTRAWCTATRMLSAEKADRPDAGEEWSSVHITGRSGEPASLHGYLAYAQACNFIATNRFEEAAHYLEECRAHQRRITRVCRLPILVGRACAKLNLARGRLREARRCLRQTLTQVVWNDDQQKTAGASAGVLLADVLYESDKLPEAERLLQQFLSPSIEEATPDILIVGHVIGARVALARADRKRALELLSDLRYLGHQAQLPRLLASYWLECSRIALNDGDIAAAEMSLQYADNPEVWAPFASRVTHANDVEQPAIGRIRFLIRTARGEEALAQIRPQLSEAEHQGRLRRVLKLKILLAEALEKADQSNSALRTLKDALQLAAAPGFVRTFADEGDTVSRLVTKVHEAMFSGTDSASTETLAFREFLERVLQSCGPTCAVPSPGASEPPSPARATESLTRSELRVLKLLALGLSNSAIAQRLFVAPTTVNAHLRKINSKLGVSNRTQAVAVARLRGLIGDS